MAQNIFRPSARATRTRSSGGLFLRTNVGGLAQSQASPAAAPPRPAPPAPREAGPALEGQIVQPNPQAPWSPTNPYNSTAFKMSKALTQMGEAVASIDDERQQRILEEDMRRAAQAQIEDVESWSEAVQKNPDLAQESPHFKAVYQQRIGENVVDRKVAQLWDEYNGSAIRNSTSAAAIQPWLEERLDPVMERMQDNQFMLAGAEQQAGQFIQQIGATHRSNANRNLIRKNEEQISQQLTSTVMSPLMSGNYDPQAVTSRIHDIEELARTQGVRGDKVNQLVVDAVTAAAVDQLDPGMLQMLEKERPNGTPGAGRTSYGVQQIIRAEAQIVNGAEAAHNRAERAEREARSRARRLLGRDVVNGIQEVLLSGEDLTGEQQAIADALYSKTDQRFMQEHGPEVADELDLIGANFSAGNTTASPKDESNMLRLLRGEITDPDQIYEWAKDTRGWGSFWKDVFDYAPMGGASSEAHAELVVDPQMQQVTQTLDDAFEGMGVNRHARAAHLKKVIGRARKALDAGDDPIEAAETEAERLWTKYGADDTDFDNPLAQQLQAEAGGDGSVDPSDDQTTSE